MSNFLFSKDSVSNSMDYLVQYLRDAGYTGSLEKGTAVYDVLLTLAASLYTVFKEETDRASAYLSLQRAEELKLVLGSEYDTVVDAILSNWFITRNIGTPSKGVLRLFFSQAVNGFSLDAGEAIAYYGTTQLIARYGRVYLASEYSSLFNTVQNRTEYFLDVESSSADASSVTIPVGSALTSGVSSVFLYRIEVFSAFSAGEEKESSASFIERSKSAVTTRELITTRAIDTVFGEQIQGLQDLYVAGYGEPEMVRDIANFGQLYLHYGNKADIYVHAEYVQKTVPITVTNIAGVSYIQVSSAIRQAIVLVQGVVVGTASVAFSYHQHTPTSWCSTRNNIVLKLTNPVASGTSAKVTVLISEVASLAQDLVYSPAQRVVCYDPLVKAKYAAMCSFNLDIKLLTGADEEGTSASIKEACVALIGNTLNMADFSVSKLAATIHTECWDIASVSPSSTFSYDILDPDTAEIRSVPITDTFVLPENISPQVSGNTVQLKIFPERITVRIL